MIGAKGHRAVGYCLVPKHGFNKLLTLERRSTTNEEHRLQKKEEVSGPVTTERMKIKDNKHKSPLSMHPVVP